MNSRDISEFKSTGYVDEFVVDVRRGNLEEDSGICLHSGVDGLGTQGDTKH